ncbi:MAG: FtsX-like permease family protein [Candidatus Heimdallarchaeota archaeon]|nr:FtsX-like permease family protein [Candidatus Heimdallarchaeota archaeon]
MSRYIAEQRRLIGVFHSFGFPQSAIIRMFVIRAIILGIIGCLLGVGSSYGILALITLSLGKSWGVAGISLSMDWLTVLVICSIAMTAILVFSIIPARRVAKMNPYEALRGKMTADVTKKTFLDRLFFTKYLPQIPRIGIRNLNRQKVRTWLTVLAVMGGLALSASLVATVDIVNYQVPKNFEETIVWDVEVTFHTPVSKAVIDSYRDHPHVTDVEPHFLYPTMTTNNKTTFTILEAHSWNSNMTVFIFEEGHGFTEKGSKECVINSRLMKELDLAIGENVTVWLYQQQLEFTIVGSVISWSSASAIIVQIEHLEPLLGSFMSYTSLRMTVEAGHQQDVMDDLNANDPKVRFAKSYQYYLNQMLEIIQVEQEIANVAEVLGFLVAFFTIFNTTFISTLERTREFAIMRAFGFSKFSIFLITEIENSVLTPIAFVAGMVLAYPFTHIFLYLIEEHAQPIPYNFSWLTVWVTFLFAIGTTFISVIPGWFSTTKKKLANTLREE